jgi:hypothetical protein
VPFGGCAALGILACLANTRPQVGALSALS